MPLTPIRKFKSPMTILTTNISCCCSGVCPGVDSHLNEYATEILFTKLFELYATSHRSGAARLRHDVAESHGRRGAGEGRKNYRARLASARGLAARGNRGASRRAKAQIFDERRDAFRNARTVLHARTHTALHRSHQSRRNQARRYWRDRSESETFR